MCGCEAVSDGVTVTCFDCKSVVPCYKRVEKGNVVICDKFIQMYPEDDTTSLEELKNINESIPEDEIVSDYSGCEEEIEVHN